MTHEDLWRAIVRLAASRNMSCSGLAKFSGLDATTFNKSKRFSKYGQPRWPSTYSIAKVLNATGITMSEFVRFMPSHEPPHPEK
ncbi:MAG: helix-turn-helix transcriptional regulator [Alphaproteobacteria bacterium]|nr:helix-turn-helix transcriptional regulator [Alphaproteobacteria bacterium]